MGNRRSTTAVAVGRTRKRLLVLALRILFVYAIEVANVGIAAGVAQVLGWATYTG